MKILDWNWHYYISKLLLWTCV